MRKELIVDTHIHIYENYNLEQFIDNALINMENLTGTPEGIKILCLTEAKNNRFFQEFSRGKNCGKYSFTKTSETSSLKIISDNKTSGYLLNGRQIVTAEGIEILALGTDSYIEDGKNSSEVIEKLKNQSTITVLGWGVGKWLFNRGKLINRLIEADNQKNLIVGDNSGRPGFWGTPAQFKTASAKGISVIAGSDPLPFKEEISKPGTYGIKGETEFDGEYPSESLKSLIRSGNFTIFGNRDSTINFFTRQFRMYTKKYIKKS